MVKKRSHNELAFETALNTYIKGKQKDYDILSLLECVREYKFHDTRGWMFDFAYPAHNVAVEIDGGTRMTTILKNGTKYSHGGRHNQDTDREKINDAVSKGWLVLRFSDTQVKNSPIQCVEVLVRTLLRVNQ